MPNQTHPWLPTTRTQSVLVYGLNVLLLFNVTVILVMMSGPKPAEDVASRHTADMRGVAAPTARTEGEPVQVQPAAVREQAVESRDVEIAGDASPTVVSEQPFVLAEAPDLRDDVVVDHRATTPVQDDAPVQFFGIGLE